MPPDPLVLAYFACQVCFTHYTTYGGLDLPDQSKFTSAPLFPDRSKLSDHLSYKGETHLKEEALE